MRHISVNEVLYDFIAAMVREDPVLGELRAATAPMPDAGMQIGPEQGAFMALLAKAIGARRYVEVGVFTGYSTLVMALALPPDGRVTACDISEEFTAIARRFWQRAGVAGRIDLRLAPAQQTLDQLLTSGSAGTYDIAFIDADKTGYDTYYEQCLQLVRTNGLILLDNMLWSGRVAEPSVSDADTVALRALNAKIAIDSRVDSVLLPIGDGVMLARKR